MEYIKLVNKRLLIDQLEDVKASHERTVYLIHELIHHDRLETASRIRQKVDLLMGIINGKHNLKDMVSALSVKRFTKKQMKALLCCYLYCDLKEAQVIWERVRSNFDYNSKTKIYSVKPLKP